MKINHFSNLKELVVSDGIFPPVSFCAWQIYDCLNTSVQWYFAIFSVLELWVTAVLPGKIRQREKWSMAFIYMLLTREIGINHFIQERESFSFQKFQWFNCQLVKLWSLLCFYVNIEYLAICPCSSVITE